MGKFSGHRINNNNGWHLESINRSPKNYCFFCDRVIDVGYSHKATKNLNTVTLMDGRKASFFACDLCLRDRPEPPDNAFAG